MIATSSPAYPAVARARCPRCGHRWPWPAGATPAEEPLVRPLVCCPACRLVVKLQPEPLDSRWWQAQHYSETGSRSGARAIP